MASYSCQGDRRGQHSNPPDCRDGDTRRCKSRTSVLDCRYRTCVLKRRSRMALPMTSSSSRRRVNPPMGELVDLGELCSKLEARLLHEELEISELRARGED